MKVSEAYMLLSDLAIGLGAAPLCKHVGCWEHTLGRWYFAINGHRSPTFTSHGVEVPPFHAYVELDGWPAGLLTPNGGTMIADAEERLIAALREHGCTVPDAEGTGR